LAAGEFFVIIAGMIDLSVASTLALSGIFYAMILKTFGIAFMPLAILAALVVGLLVGLFNGIIVSRFNIPAFITTLGSMLIVRGIVYLSTNSYPITGLPEGADYVGRGWLFGLPFPIFIVAIVYIFAIIFSEKKRSGRFLFAIGGNAEAARLSGINVKRYQTLAYVLCGIISAVSGIIMAGRLGSGHPNAGLNYEFEAIIAVVIGGVSFSGGKGKALGVLFGAFFMTMFLNGMTLLAVDSNVQNVIKGFVFILAIGVDVLRNREKK
jgi:ribose transport system permease protein